MRVGCFALGSHQSFRRARVLRPLHIDPRQRVPRRRDRRAILELLEGVEAATCVCEGAFTVTLLLSCHGEVVVEVGNRSQIRHILGQRLSSFSAEIRGREVPEVDQDSGQE